MSARECSSTCPAMCAMVSWPKILARLRQHPPNRWPPASSTMSPALHLLIFGQKQARQNGHDEDHWHAVVGEDALHQLRENGEDAAHWVNPMPTASDSAAMVMLRCEKPALAII